MNQDFLHCKAFWEAAALRHGDQGRKRKRCPGGQEHNLQLPTPQFSEPQSCFLSATFLSPSPGGDSEDHGAE